MYAQVLTLRVSQHNRRSVAMHHTADTRRRSHEQIVKLQIGNHLVREIENQLQALLHPLGYI